MAARLSEQLAFRALTRDQELQEEFREKYQSTSVYAPFMETAQGLEAMAVGAAPQALEAIVKRFTRPSLIVFADDFEVPEAETWRNRLEPFRTAIRSAIPAVGRVEILNYPSDYVGTAWMIRPDVAVTNRHVAELFTTRANGVYPLAVSANGAPFDVDVDFIEELDNPASRALRVEEVLYVANNVDTEPDLAFLRLTPNGVVLPEPIALAEDAPSGELVVNIGYPAQDYRQDADDQARIFRGLYNIKRLAPGELTAVTGTTISHDCTTLGGSSGSVVFSPSREAAVGLHFAGTAGLANYAVPAATVETYFQRYAVGTPSPVPLGGTPAPVTESPVDADALARRKGYDADFLENGFFVPFPSPAGKQWLEVATPLLTDNSEFLLHYAHFSLAMHKERRLAMVTATNIDGARQVRLKRTADKWYYDPRIDKEAQIGAELYDANPLDRGHLVRRLDPAFGDADDAAVAVADTFHWTNCAPQHESFNRTLWAGLEDYLLESAATHGFRACIFTGPIFNDDDPDYRSVARIPQAFWKVAVVLTAGDQGPALSTTGYVVSQESLVANIEFAYGPYRTYQVPVSRITRWSGLRFGDEVEAADPLKTQENALRYREVRDPAEILL